MNFVIKRKIYFIGLSILLIAVSMLITSLRLKVKTKGENDESAHSWALFKLKEMSLEEKIGQFFMVAAYSNQSEEQLSEVEKQVTDDKIGGIIFFQGERSNLKAAIHLFQSKSKIPLLIGMDAEWGIQMRIFGEERFPYAYTIGAANDLQLTERIGKMMAQECRELGIHMNFSPVADVNSNADNPVIGFRSFGENPEQVAKQVEAMVKGMEQYGVLTTIKHFPGHGNTDKDSHLELPTVSSSFETIQAVDFKPFISGINAGSGSVMIGHLNVPALDASGVPTSLSPKIIKDYLQKQLGYKGLIISDALNMKAVADKYGKTEVCVKAFQAGCDILLFPESVGAAIQAIKSKVESGEIAKKEIDERCLKVLEAKYKYVFNPKKITPYTEGEIEWAKQEVYEKAITVLKNNQTVLPLAKMDQRIAKISIGAHTVPFKEGIQRFSKVDHYHFYTAEEAIERMKGKLDNYNVIITAFHTSTVRPKKQFGMTKGWEEWIQGLPASAKNIGIVFGNPLVLGESSVFDKFDGLIVTYENNKHALERTSQFLMGAIPADSKLTFSIPKTNYKLGSGIKVNSTGRLKFSSPEELGISYTDLKKIDNVVENGIKAGAFPGCQIVVAYDGKIFLRKAYGHKQYDDSIPVKNTDVYDIASVTKIAGSTFGVMRLQTLGKFSCDKTLKDYIPEVTGKGDFGNILIRDMMTHQAGLTPWIPFFKKTLINGELNSAIYSTEKKKGYEKQVAKDLWIKDSYTDTIYKQILSSTLGPKKYEYSDLGYYFIKKIVEKQMNLAYDDYLMKQLYLPMGLQYMRYQPKNYFALNQIVPTENDKTFRHQQIHGYVHDPGAAMLGGVAGHAGLFSNATDLASVMQVFMNKGYYGGVRYIDEQVVDEYTKCQYCPSNRRGIGFDRPKLSGGGTCHEVATQSSYGHSGFTGTLAWADPQAKINYVFLSNRVFPSQDNWKIRDMNIRTDIQQAIYQAIANAKHKN